METKKILVVSGEPSGDMNAAALVKALARRMPGLRVDAVGGDALRAAGAHIVADIKELAAFGLFDVLTKLPRFFRLRDALLARVRTDPPDAVVLVDFSGFNLRLAKALNNAVPVLYYISPQVWASRQGRVRTIKRYVRKMIVLFPFEVTFYRSQGIEAELAGSPLLDLVKPTQPRDAFLRAAGLDPQRPVLALLPGSRRQEVAHILPVMLDTLRLLTRTVPGLQALIARAPQVDEALYKQIITRYNEPVVCIPGRAYDCINAADFCLVASGTATLETTILGKAFFIVYRMNALNYLLYRPQVKVPHIGMVNLVAGRRVVPEFVQGQARPDAIAREALPYFTQRAVREGMERQLRDITGTLGTPGAAGRAADVIATFLTHEN